MRGRDRLARALREEQDEAGGHDPRAGNRRSLDLRAAIRAHGWSTRDRHLVERREARARAGARRVGDDQLRHDARMGGPGARAHRRHGRRPRRRGGRLGDDGSVGQGDPAGRNGLADRRAHGPRRAGRPAPDELQGPPRPGDRRRVARDVRGHEPGHLRQRHETRDRPRVPLRGGARGISPSPERPPRRQGRDLDQLSSASRRSRPSRSSPCSSGTSRAWASP